MAAPRGPDEAHERAGLSVTVLGCSGTYAAAGNACSGYLVRSPTATVWIDCGPGTLAAVQTHVGLDSIDAVVLSHSHPDHWMELPVLRNAWKYAIGRDRVPVLGTAETRALAEAVVPDGLDPTLDWTVVTDGDEVTVEDLTFTFSRTDHPVETLAMRVDHGGASLAYSADTGPGWDLGDLSAAGPVDLFICEATLARADEGSAPHLSAAQAGSLASAGGARRLVLTHLIPGADPDDRRREAESTFGAEVQVAGPGARFECDPRPQDHH